LCEGIDTSKPMYPYNPYGRDVRVPRHCEDFASVLVLLLPTEREAMSDERSVKRLPASF
jgi:hypothetical protein